MRPASFFAGLVFCTLVVVASFAQAAPLQVYAAASLSDAMAAVKTAFQKVVPGEVVLVFGSSSTLSKQIVAGAPADVFISANQHYAEAVAEDRNSRAIELFQNQLVIVAPDSFEGEMTLKNLAAALGDGRLAVGDPAHVPAGIYAQQALEAAGIWDELEDRLAPASDVRGAVAFVASGASPFGIVYKTDAAVEGVKIVGEIAPDLHEPIAYYGVALTPPGDLFITYIVSFDGQNWLDYFGFQTVITPK